MSPKFALVAALLSMSSFIRAQQSVASQGQIAYAISQSYDQTGPGTSSGSSSSSQSTSSSPQVYSASSQRYQAQPQTYTQPQAQSYTPQTQPQSYSHQYFTPPHHTQQQQQQQQQQPQHQQQQQYTIQYTQAPQTYSQPQIYSQAQQSYPTLQSLGRYESSQSQPQVAYVTPAQYSALTQQMSYAPQVATYSHAPQAQVAYASVPQSAYASLAKAQQVKTVQAVQHETAYDLNPQYTYTYDVQDSGDSKAQQDTRQVDYTYEEPESNTRTVEYSAAELQSAYNAAIQQKQQTKVYEPQYIAKPIYTAPIAKTAYQTVVKPVYNSAPIGKYASPIQQQYTFGH